MPHSKTQTLSVDRKLANRSLVSTHFVRLAFHFLVRLGAYFHLVSHFSRLFYSFTTLSLFVLCVVFYYWRVPFFLPLFWLSVPFNYFRHYCQSSGCPCANISKTTNRIIAYYIVYPTSVQKSSLRVLFGVFLVAYIRYYYSILVVSTGKTGVLKLIKKLPLRFHSFMSPF